jgi:citrate synthase
MPKDSLTITDNRTGKQYEIPIELGAIRSADLRQIKLDKDDFGLMGYDPAFTNTASCKSRITFIDGDRGILLYRGYPIEDLAEHSNYLETAYLIVKGELPDARHFKMWQHNITVHTFVHENVKMFMDGFRYDAHPMGMLLSTIGALSTFYPDAKEVDEIECRRTQTRRLIGKLPTLAAFAYRRTRGLPYIYPDNELGYTGNFLQMLFKIGERVYKPNRVLERALDVLFILHADHEQNCSTNAVRSVGSSRVDPYSAVAAGVAALYGPLHGGANEAVIRMLQEIGSVEKVPDAIKRFKAGDGRLMGFGHRVYRVDDARARVLRGMAKSMAEATGRQRLFEVAERVYDTMRARTTLPVNVDFFSAVVYDALNIPPDLCTSIFAIGRVAGWCAHAIEQYADNRLIRPRADYTGPQPRSLAAASVR